MILHDTGRQVKRKPRGAGILFTNSVDRVLLYLRDNKSSIRFPNCWDMLGGGVEAGESPRRCIIREIKEEIGYKLRKPELFKITQFEDRTEYTFYQFAEFNIDLMTLNEGQYLSWFSRHQFLKLPARTIAFGFREIILDYFAELPYLRKQHERDTRLRSVSKAG